ncbi:MAG: hypothetical protein Q7S32_03465 [bacterium]|nr:hypothetical protein [bacterium]
MPTTNLIKLLMIGLFIVAGLVVARVGILINKTFHPAVARIFTITEVDYEDSEDFDHDGLTNSEEAVWRSDPYNADTDQDGYLDGEEVFSDHSPTIAETEGDSLSAMRNFLALNSTERMAQIIAGGVMSGDLKQIAGNTDIYASSIDTVAESSVYSVLSALESVDVPEEPQNIVSDGKESEERYLKVVFNAIAGDILDLAFNQPKEFVLLFSPNQNAPGGDVFDPQQKDRIKTKFLEHSVKFQQAYETLNSAAVPQSWIAVHKRTVTLLKKLELYYRSIALSVDDPLKQMIVLGNLQTVYMEAQPILIEIDKKIKGRNLTAPDNDFFSISLLLSK